MSLAVPSITLDYSLPVGRMVSVVFRGTVKSWGPVTLSKLDGTTKTSVLQNSSVSLVWNVVKSKKQKQVT